jgi:hypothetical protein
MKLNNEITKRVNEIRKKLTCIAFAERPSEYEREQEKLLNKEYDEIVANYDIVEGYIATQTVFKSYGQEQVELSDVCDTYEEALKYTEGLRYTDIERKIFCYDRKEV